MQAVHRSEDTKASAYSPLHIIFMGLRIAKIDEEAVTEILGDMPVKALDHRCARGLVGAHDLPQVFGVELG